MEDQRKFKRYPKSSKIFLKHRDRLLAAEAVDYCFDGVGIWVKEGDAAGLTEGEVVNLEMDGSEGTVFLQVKWSHRDEDRLRVGLENIGPLRGRLGNFILSDLIIGLQRSQKTGTLIIQSGDIIKKVYIRNGDVIFSSSSQDEDRLGDMLLRNGSITREQFNLSVEDMKKTGQRQGTVLVERGFLRPDALVKAVKSQVEEIIMSLFRLEDGVVTFKEGPLPTEEVITLRLSAATLIYFGIKGMDWTGNMKDRLPSAESIPCFTEEPIDLFQDLKLDSSGKKILSAIDGLTTVRDIISITGMKDLDVLKTLYALLNVRIIETRDEKKPIDDLTQEIIAEAVLDSADLNERQGPVKEVLSEIENLHKRLERLGHYEILEVRDYATAAQIKKAYYKAAWKFHPDVHFSYSDDSLMAKLSDIFARIYEAYAVLSKPQTRKEYDKSLTIAPSRLKATQDKARAAFEDGKLSMKEKDYKKAEILFGQAIYFDKTISDYHYYSGLNFMKLGRFKDAELALKEALRLEPFNPDYLAEFGFAMLALGMPLRAKSSFEKALKVAPQHKKALAGLTKVRNTQ